MNAFWEENDSPKCSLNKIKFSLQIEVVQFAFGVQYTEITEDSDKDQE